jgi:hypothetical protein
MNRSARELEMRIVGLWLEGWSRDSIAEELWILASVVTDLTSALPASLEALRELKRYFRKIGLSALTLRLVFEKMLREVGEEFKVELSPRLVEYAVRAAKDKKYEINAVVGAAKKLVELEEQAGMPYPEAITKYEAITSEDKNSVIAMGIWV